MEALKKSIHKLEYLTIVAYYDNARLEMSRLVDDLRGISAQVLGDKAVIGRLYDSTVGVGPNGKLSLKWERKLSLKLSSQWEPYPIELANASCLFAMTRAIRGESPKDRLWCLEYKANPISSGIMLAPYVRVDFGLNFMTNDEIAHLAVQLTRLASALASATGFVYGLIDIGDVFEIARGDYYSGTGQGYVVFQRKLSRYLWEKAYPKRGILARGVFWGNLFGPDMVEKLGGSNVFVQDYRKLEDRRDHNLCTALEDGSVFVRISTNISDMQFPYFGLLPPAFERAAWLYERLSAAHLLCGT